MEDTVGVNNGLKRAGTQPKKRVEMEQKELLSAENVLLPSQEKEGAVPDSTKYSTGDPKFDAENPEWLSCRSKVDESPNSARPWDALITVTEQLLQKYPIPSETVKTVIIDTFEEILSRFPLFHGYWKKYTSVQYQLNGLEASLSTLSKALDAFPASLDLWIDYLTLLISNQSDDTTKIRTEFEASTRFVGNQFLSHTLWDKYIEFEKGQKSQENVIKILLRVVEIPLHQYARYYQELTTIKDTIPIDEMIALMPTLSTLVTSESSLEQKTQAVTDHITRVCTNTYTYVTEIWPFESRIAESVIFTLSPVSQELIDFWKSYLEFQLKKYETDPSPLNKAQTVSVFERALIPTALDPSMWYMYLRWANKHFLDDYDMLNGIYNRAVNLYVPVNVFAIRLNYALFLEVQRQDADKIHELYINVIKYVPGETLPLLQYIQFVTRLNDNYKRTADWLDSLLSTHFGLKKPETELDFHSLRLSKLLNEKHAGILASELIKILWHRGKDHLKVKMLMSLYSKQDSLASSTSYWTTCYTYQKALADPKAVEKVVQFIKNSSGLPLKLINDVLLDYSDYLQQNPLATLTNALNVHRQILELEYDVAHPLHYRVVDEKQIKRARAESGHAAVYIEKPSFTNSLLEEPAKRHKPAALPTFKNVEKASLPIVYTPDE